MALLHRRRTFHSVPWINQPNTFARRTPTRFAGGFFLLLLPTSIPTQSPLKYLFDDPTHLCLEWEVHYRERFTSKCEWTINKWGSEMGGWWQWAPLCPPLCLKRHEQCLYFNHPLPFPPSPSSRFQNELTSSWSSPWIPFCTSSL